MYLIHRVQTPPKLDEGWGGASWQSAETLSIANWYPANVEHRPRTQAKLLYDSHGLYVMFHVDDRYVRATRTTYQADVCKDSCAEFFVQPVEGKGYFNFEMNCIGTLLNYYIEDPTRAPGGFKKYTEVSAELGQTVQRHHSLDKKTDKEITEPTEWTIAYFIPFQLFEHYVGALQDLSGKIWKANFYKCGDETSHPHWGTWAPIGKELNFHQPAHFASIRFAP